MKKNNIITILGLAIAGIAVITGCDSKREPGKIYMPDMTYARSLETYVLLNDTVFTSDPSHPGHEIFYNRKPVDGTVRKDDLFAFTLPHDSSGYTLSATVKNPLPPLNKKELAETGRLFNINCAICHGATGTANGPLSTHIGAIANLATPAYIDMADGTMFYSIQYGKNNMGSYASQLSRKQRWMLVHYIRTLQPKPATTESTVVAEPVKKDSATTKRDKK